MSTMELNEILKIALKGGASDIHLKAGLPPMFRVDGALVPLKDGKRLMPEVLQQMAFGIMNPVQRQRFEEFARGRPRLRRPGPRPLPRQRVPAARHRRHRAPRDPVRA